MDAGFEFLGVGLEWGEGGQCFARSPSFPLNFFSNVLKLLLAEIILLKKKEKNSLDWAELGPELE